MADNKPSPESLRKQGMHLSIGLIIGNGLICPLIFPNRNVMEGLAIGAIAALICLGLYTYRASQLTQLPTEQSK